MKKIVIIGGGAAGLAAAGRVREEGGEPVIIERGNRTGKKLAITGKGRCNVTNNCDIQTLIANIPTNPRFLYGAFSGFEPSDTMGLFESLGVPLKTERGNRVFPVSDKASDIVGALRRYAGDCVRLNTRALSVVTEQEPYDDKPRAVAVKTDHGILECDAVILAAGGASYPVTGSDGDGYRIAAELGHNIISPRPSLVPLEVSERWCRALQGLSLRNISMKVIDTESDGVVVYEDFGELLFTHFGLSGPIVLSASSHVRNITSGRYKVVIDLKPSLDEKTLDARLLSDFAKYSNKNFSNALDDLLPKKLIPVMIELSGISSDRKIHSLTREERHALLTLFKSLTLTITRPRPIAEAIITSGGVDTREISPKTMESKLVDGLYFAGEIIDVDAYTGGFNLQIAFSTAIAAAKACCGW